MIASPLSSASGETSNTVTGMPALAKFIAMPPPIVPQPITAAVSIGRVGVSLGTSGILATWRSAKNACRCAFDWSEATSRMNVLRSVASPSANGWFTAASMQATHAYGASNPRARRAIFCLNSPKISGVPRASASLSSSADARRGGPVLVDAAPRAGDRRIDHVALDHLVDHPERLCLGGRHHLAAHDHVERRRHADQTG